MALASSAHVLSAWLAALYPWHGAQANSSLRHSLQSILSSTHMHDLQVRSSSGGERLPLATQSLLKNLVSGARQCISRVARLNPPVATTTSAAASTVPAINTTQIQYNSNANSSSSVDVVAQFRTFLLHGKASAAAHRGDAAWAKTASVTFCGNNSSTAADKNTTTGMAATAAATGARARLTIALACLWPSSAGVTFLLI